MYGHGSGVPLERQEGGEIRLRHAHEAADPVDRKSTCLDPTPHGLGGPYSRRSISAPPTAGTAQKLLRDNALCATNVDHAPNFGTAGFGPREGKSEHLPRPAASMIRRTQEPLISSRPAPGCPANGALRRSHTNGYAISQSDLGNHLSREVPLRPVGRRSERVQLTKDGDSQ